MRFTCLQFREGENSDGKHISIKNYENKCWSSVGYSEVSEQIIVLSETCTSKDIIHVFLHAAGFFHQQSSPERDNHVEIKWENILEGYKRNFDKYAIDTSFGQPYDFNSIMHFRRDAFSSNGQPTILAKTFPESLLMGEAKTLSKIDVYKINTFYNCN